MKDRKIKLLGYTLVLGASCYHKGVHIGFHGKHFNPIFLLNISKHGVFFN